MPTNERNGNLLREAEVRQPVEPEIEIDNEVSASIRETSKRWLVDVIKAHKLPENVKNGLLQELAKKKTISGNVILIMMKKDVERKMVGKKGWGREVVIFDFPPNDEKFDDELKRAQNHGLSVEVDYHLDDKHNPIIDSVLVQS